MSLAELGLRHMKPPFVTTVTRTGVRVDRLVVAPEPMPMPPEPKALPKSATVIVRPKPAAAPKRAAKPKPVDDGAPKCRFCTRPIDHPLVKTCGYFGCPWR